MNPDTFNRLHSLRMENDAAGYAMEDMKPRFSRIAGRHENGTAPRAVSSFQLFQTPVDIAADLVAMLGPIPAGSRILEPSAGLGRLLDALPQGCEVVAVEMAAQCAAELYNQNREGVMIKQRDFLTLTPQDLGLFDFVVMNPPFHMRADIRHILHARQFLKPSGKLAALCFNTRERHTQLKPLAQQWVDLPAGAFGKDGTRVETAMLTMNKALTPSCQ